MIGIEVGVLRPTLSEPNARNTRARVYPYSPTHTVWAKQFAPGGQPEAHEPGRNPVQAAPTLYLLAGSDVTEYDRVSVHGRIYDVDGSPDHWTNARTGRQHGIVVRLKSVEG